MPQTILAQRSGSTDNAIAKNDDHHEVLASDPTISQFPQGSTFGDNNATNTSSSGSSAFGAPSAGFGSSSGGFGSTAPTPAPAASGFGGGGFGSAPSATATPAVNAKGQKVVPQDDFPPL